MLYASLRCVKIALDPKKVYLPPQKETCHIYLAQPTHCFMVVDCFALGYTRTLMVLIKPSTFLFFLVNARLATFLFPLLLSLISTSASATATV